MPKLPAALSPAGIPAALRFWNHVKNFSTAQIAAEAERPFTLALVGTDDETALLAHRLSLETPVPRDSAHGPANVRPFLSFHAQTGDVPADHLWLDAATAMRDEGTLAAALAQMVVARPDLRLSLARHIPAFRPAVATQLINEVSWDNARLATLSALPGIIPFTDILLPATAIGDTILLTKNQAMLLLQIAAAYGLPVDIRARSKELLPIVAGAFGWRSLVREALGIVPAGIGVVVKGAVAYAGTYTAGKAAAIYYSTGQTLSGARMRQLYKDALRESVGRVRQLMRREKKTGKLPANERMGEADAHE